MGLAVDSHDKISFTETAWIQSIVDLCIEYGIKTVLSFAAIFAFL